MFNIAICDDEKLYLEMLKKTIGLYLTERQIDFQINCFESGKQLIDDVKKELKYHIIFLDVSMQDLDGMETAKIIRTISNNVYIIFITAFITYALDGYKVDAVRYLLKGDKKFDCAMRECLDTVIDKMNYKEDWIELEFQTGVLKVSSDRILYIESRLHKLIFFVLEDGIKEYSRYDKLDTVQAILEGKGFYRVHQSFLVNMKHVKMIERYKVYLTEGSEISVSKKYYKDAECEYLKLRGEM